MKINSMQKNIGVVAVFVSAILWGTTGTAATFVPDLSPLAIGAFAMGVGGILQCLVAIKSIAHQYKLLINNWSYLLIGGLAVTVYPLAFYSSMKMSGVAIGTVITIGSAPLISALLEYYFDNQKLTYKWLYGSIVGVIGMVLLSFTDSSIDNINSNSQITIGIVLGIIAGLTYSIYSWSAHHLMAKGASSFATMGAIFGVGGLFLTPVLIMTGAPLLHSWVNASVGVYMALIPMFIGYVFYGIGLSRIKASTATAITLIEPVIAALLAIILVGEKLLIINWIGIGLVILCLVIISTSSRNAS